MNKQSALKSKTRTFSLNTQVSRNNPFFMMLIECMHLDISCGVPSDKRTIIEWFYNAEKGSRFANSVFSKKEFRDHRAFMITETFRKRFFDPETKYFTPEFLGAIVRKIKFLNSSTFYDFVNFVIRILTKTMNESFDWEACAKIDYSAQVKFLSSELMSTGNIVFQDKAGNVESFVLASDGKFEIFFADRNEGVPEIHLKGKGNSVRKLLEYDPYLLINQDQTFFYTSYATYTNGQSSINSHFAVIPFNQNGDSALLNGELMFKKIAPEMMCFSTDTNLVKSIYLEVVIFDTSLSKFRTYVPLMLRFMNLHSEDMMIYMGNETEEKRDLIRVMGMKEILRNTNTTIGSMEHAIYGIRIVDYFKQISPRKSTRLFN